MIFDSLVNLPLYLQVHPGFADIQAFITTTDLSALAVGSHPINADGAFASVNEYATKASEDCIIECHRKYIDVQLITCGTEKIGVTHKDFCTEKPYDSDKDLQLLTGRVDFITLVPGLFAVFFPHDAHEPGVAAGAEAVSVKKIVFKIQV